MNKETPQPLEEVSATDKPLSTDKPFKKWFIRIGVVGLWLIILIGSYLLFASNTQAYEGTRGVKIPAGSGFSVICDSLESAGILDSRWSFELVATATLWRKQMKSGYYEFESGTSNYGLLDKIRNGLQTPIRVTIPPGVTPERVGEILEAKLDLPQSEFLALMQDESFATSLGTDTKHLFAYMMPETYFVDWDTPLKSVIKRIKRDFEARVTDDMKTQAKKMNWTIEEALRMASIVQWETPKEEEKPIVAGVYWNRLKTGMRLQADPTVQYALMEYDGGPMRRLFFRDYEFAHPYNTYLHDGLPPGPVTNPSFSSLQAALNPQKHNYIYFVADGTGGHNFSVTYGEHLRKSREIQALLRERRREQATTN